MIKFDVGEIRIVDHYNGMAVETINCGMTLPTKITTALQVYTPP